jgi:hypothetical protein
VFVGRGVVEHDVHVAVCRHRAVDRRLLEHRESVSWGSRCRFGPSPRRELPCLGCQEPLSKLTVGHLSTVSHWLSERRRPSFESAMKVGSFFDIPPHRLAQARFQDLLADELGDEERYQRVETRIKRGITRLKAVS